MWEELFFGEFRDGNRRKAIGEQTAQAYDIAVITHYSSIGHFAEAVEMNLVTIEYSLTRTEIVLGFFRSLRSSPKYRLTILLNATVIAALVLLLRIASSRNITVSDVFIAVTWALGFLVFMPLWLFIRGKTAKRMLTISPDGICTEIGKIRAQVPWNKINLVTPAEQYILIARPGGNSFFVPLRAFSGLEQPDQFLGEISRWMKSTG